MKIATLTRNEISELSELGKSAALRYETQRVLVEGSRAIAGAKLSGAVFEMIISSDKEAFDEELLGVKFCLVDDKSIQKIATTPNPQNVLAICKMPAVKIADFERAPFSRKNIFILDHVSDPGNLGTIIRSCVAFDVGAIVTLGGCDPYHPKVVRSSAGALFACPILTVDEYQIEKLIGNRKIYCADSGSAKEMEETEFEDNSCIVLGNEANGIITEFFQKNAINFGIAMQELCESLNVAMTATIVAHHLHSKKRGK